MRRTSVFASGENLGAERIHFARAFKYKRVEAAFGSRNPKRKTRFQRVFLLGKSLQSRYFKFWTDRLKSCPPALQGRAAFAAFERFAAGKTSTQEWLCHSEHFNPEGRSGPTGREVHKKGHDVSRVLFCGTSQHYRCRFSLSMCQNTNHNSIIYSSICSTFAVITISMPSYK